MKLSALFSAALLLTACLLAPVSAAAPVAMITDIKGKVTLVDGSRSRPATVLAYLEADNRLQLEAGSQVVLSYFTKAIEVTLSGPGEASVATDGARVSKGAKSTQRSLDAGRIDTARKFEPMAREKLALATVHMRSSPKPAPRPTSPVDTVIINTRPSLDWAELPSATGYRVVVRDASGMTVLDQQVAKPPLAIGADRALRAGGDYEWRVEAKLASGAVVGADAKFSVADAGRGKAVEQSRPAADASFSERLLYAAQLESEGMREAARPLWQALARERPDEDALKRWAGE